METGIPVVKKMEVRKTARVLTGGKETGKPMVFLHGYGMRVEGFFGRLGLMIEKGFFVVAPEALSRYYREGSSGKVVASWMTREERLDDISDNNQYLDQVFRTFCKKPDAIFIGFSQGAASMCRWAFTSSHNVNDIVLWGSTFPPDINDQAQDAAMGRIRIHFIIGTDDEYLTVDQIEEESEQLRMKGFDSRVFIYEGNHNISREGLDYIASI